MRGILTKTLKIKFEESLKQKIATACLVKLPAGTPGSMGWLIGMNEKAKAYVILVVSPRDDRFTIEIAWSLNDRIPSHTGKMPGEEKDTGELCFRLSRLWRPDGFEVWYDLQYDGDYPDSGPYSPSMPEQTCLDRIPIKVNRAIKAIEEHGIPYLKRTIGHSFE